MDKLLCVLATSLIAISTGAQAGPGDSDATTPGVVRSVPTPNGTSPGVAAPASGTISSNDVAPNGTPLANGNSIGIVQSASTPNGTSPGVAAPAGGTISSNDVAPNGTPLVNSN